MINSLTRSFIGLVALVGIGGTAQAAFVPATWTDTYDNGTGVYLGAGESYDYYHDIAFFDDFKVGSDVVTDFLLTIDIFDDRADKWYELELARINIPGILGDGFVSSFSFGDDAYAGWSIAGLFELNLLGTLSVTISSIFGDFVVGTSDLVANGYAHVADAPSTSVPEPSTLALLGLGLLGVAAGARRRKGKANVTR